VVARAERNGLSSATLIFIRRAARAAVVIVCRSRFHVRVEGAPFRRGPSRARRGRQSRGVAASSRRCARRSRLARAAAVVRAGSFRIHFQPSNFAQLMSPEADERGRRQAGGSVRRSRGEPIAPWHLPTHRGSGNFGAADHALAAMRDDIRLRCTPFAQHRRPFLGAAKIEDVGNALITPQ
jgi:hypothetical protein